MKSVDWFESKSEGDPNGGCWLWGGYIQNRGYGVYAENGRRKLAHRGAWEAANKEIIPRGLFVCHKCDVRACVNPDHLWVGSALDNNRDAMSKGRMRWQLDPNWLRQRPFRRGEAHPCAKLTDSDVRGIRALDGKESQEAIAKKYGVTASTVSQIVNGKSRGYVDPSSIVTRNRKNSLTEEQVRQAKAMRTDGATYLAIAKSLGVHRITAMRAINGRIY
jgi:transposase